MKNNFKITSAKFTINKPEIKSTFFLHHLLCLIQNNHQSLFTLLLFLGFIVYI